MSSLLFDFQEEDRFLAYGGVNYSITGIEIEFKRHKFKYVYVYYLPSGKMNQHYRR